MPSGKISEEKKRKENEPARACVGEFLFIFCALSFPCLGHQPILAQNVIRWIKRGHYFIMSNNHVHSNRIFGNSLTQQQWQQQHPMTK